MATTVLDTTAVLESLLTTNKVYRNLRSGPLIEHSVRRGEGHLADNGALAAYTGKYAGRAPKDKFTVKDSITADKVNWGDINQPFDAEKFDALFDRVIEYLRGRDLYVQDLYAGADPKYRLPVRVINQLAWQNLFARALFVRPTAEELKTYRPEFTIVCAPEFQADPQRDGTRSEVFIIVNFTRRVIIIGGSKYAGEMKKSIFGIMNFLLPQRDVFPMHCSANAGKAGDTALFFGLSGTGKTTLSADPERHLIGDDEHGWGATGIFNFEGGCYAKVIRLSEEAEPQIFATTRRFGTILENVAVDESGVLDLDDESKTENTRAAYKLEEIANALPAKRAGHPSSVVMLTADAFGILPPIARLTREQAMFYFLSGYTAKVAGTEIGVTEPQPTFSTCFGAPFLPQPPSVYAQMLGEKLAAHGVTAWLVNTGWTGGPFGEGERMPIAATRALLGAALSGELDGAEYRTDELFGFEVPKQVPGVESSLLDPRSTWRDPEAYDGKARELAQMFRSNYEHFEADAPPEVAAAGPRV